ncbi:IMPACT family protein [Pusillimonas noertemannii]|uniref:Putative YigZ family protein n=1 Tax=Pusillimonas noertemannii TaxID=305977 RepID=A0A2U1CJZ0_9BURK|nr:YigZ family protein [Pusillimonas noertemannii]NYT69771.1 YigZ family protein [Pusillimonas noertemannii]PVY61305.1 putative YigZ family protein [Pusillimonas noertemannii]TFL09077.1 YigZ family protein [Pusillimonas noertemannii]
MLYTLEGLHAHEEEIKKSRFLAMAGPAGSAQEALDFIATHSVVSATHNCWAYRVGDAYRFNDDGEPGGTAGRPILMAIDGQQCDQAVVLVVRWFGGVKLGSGGLVRAYGGAAAQCLRLAPKAPIVPRTMLACRCPFGDMALIQSKFAGLDVTVAAEDFDAEGVAWQLALPSAHAHAFMELFIDLTRGRGEIGVKGAG